MGITNFFFNLIIQTAKSILNVLMLIHFTRNKLYFMCLKQLDPIEKKN